MGRQKSVLKTFPSGLLFLSLAYLYLSTIAPDLTWANNGADGGDLISAAVTGGIAHPSGYPLYLLIARAFQLIPIGSLAFRTNFMSALFAICTALLVYATVARYLHIELGALIASIAGLSAGFAIGLSPLFWSQAIITEVYTLHAFFITLILYLTVRAAKSKQGQNHLDRLKGIVYGVAASNHLTALLVFPGALIARYSEHRSDTQKLSKTNDYIKSVGRQLIWAFLGLALYAVLPIRALNHPIINWGDPVTLENFWWLISGKLYRVYYLQGTLTDLWLRITSSTSLLIEQFGLLGIILGFIGLIVFFRRSQLHLLTIWNGLIFLIVSITYQSPDSYVYFIPTIISFSIWIGICVGFSIHYFNNHARVINIFLVAILIIHFTLGGTTSWHQVDASQDNRATDFAKEVLIATPDNAIVFADGDQAIFALWYFHFALGKRPDLTVLATDLLHYEWYQDSMRRAYPKITIPGPFPWPTTIAVANPNQDICFVKYDQQTEIFCE